MNVKIHQIFYDETQKSFLDEKFIPYNNEGKTFPFNFEYAVLFDLYNKTDWSKTDYLGTVSWKYNLKTGFNAGTFLESISQQPDKDVYFINPFPELCVYNSVWEQGNVFHPELLKIAEPILKSCGYGSDLLTKETPPNLTAYCNYWVANKRFWDSYIEFLTPLWNYVKKEAESGAKPLGQKADQLTGSPYLPFVFERMFSSFLSANNFKVLSIPIYSGRHKKYPLLTWLYSRITKVSQQSSQKDVSTFDKLIIFSFHKAKKVVNFYIPILVRKLKSHH